MIRIALGSDLHIEFGQILLKNTGDADLLVLAGDICVARNLEFLDSPNTNQQRQAVRYMEFFEQASKEFPQIIYVMGNHEHYHGDFKYTHGILKRSLAKFPNIHVLEKETLVIDDVTFICGTLWTDMNKEDPMTIHGIKRSMNDFQCVENSNMMVSRKVPLYEDKELATDLNTVRKITGYKFKEDPSKFSPMDSVDDHKKMLDYIRHVTAEKPNDKFVVVGHHTPSFLSNDPQFAHETLMNGAFHSELSDFILDRPQIIAWHHGHTHVPFRYQIGDTWIMCNPRGYVGSERIAQTFDLIYYDIVDGKVISMD